MAYATIAEVRALDGLSDSTTWPDATITAAIEWAEELIDRYTGTSWTAKAFTVTLSGRGSNSILLRDNEGRPILYPLSLTAVSISGVALVAGDWTAWGLYPHGRIIRDSGSFAHTTAGRNVVISGTAGKETVCPKDIAWCCRTLAAQYALDLVSRVPDRALQIQNDFGTVQLSQATNHPDRPTSLPEVNARLSRRRQIPDSVIL